MKRVIWKITAFIMAAFLSAGFVAPAVSAAETTDQEVQDVITQLEAIDTLQQMQDKRSQNAVKSRYNVYTTKTSIINAHENARAEYETYIAKMFAARIAAQQAYDALNAEQKAQIDPALAAKLNNNLDLVFKTGTYAVTPRNDEYIFEAVDNAEEGGMAYEASNHVTAAPEIPATYVLVDTSNGQTTWTPSGRYVCGESNYEVTYCCDMKTDIVYGTDYKRVNLEDSSYYGKSSSQHIRAILQNAYPFVSIEEMKTNLKANGLNAAFVDSLTRSDVIAAVQMAIWAYSNTYDEGMENNFIYGSSYDIDNNRASYMNPLLDNTNECWTWWTTAAGNTSYDARAEYRVNTLVYYLCNLEGVAASNEQVVISDVKVARADLIPGADGDYRIGMYVYLNGNNDAQDDLLITVTSYHTNADGTVSVTAQSNQRVEGRNKIDISVKAKSGDTVKVVVEGRQKVEKGVYFYEPEGGRSVSQCLVGVADGYTNVWAAEEFEFVEDVGEMGLRIYKTENESGFPISDIAFSVYKVDDEEGIILSEKPTSDEVEKYATEENRVGTVVTDKTGYAGIDLDKGIYLVVEEHNTDKVVAPAKPFYVSIPMNEETKNEDGTVTVRTLNIASVYPKNEPTIPPEEPPFTPPYPDNVTGKFEILKYDEADKDNVLAGAKFEVYRAATSEDTDTEIILCDGIQYAVVPAEVNGEKVVLTTDDAGKATSPELPCGVYFLVETKAPAGYNLLDGAVTVKVHSNEMTTIASVEIPNQRGSILPETGGMGTTWFMITGSVLMIMAAVFLVTGKYMNRYK